MTTRRISGIVLGIRFFEGSRLSASERVKGFATRWSVFAGPIAFCARKVTMGHDVYSAV